MNRRDTLKGGVISGLVVATTCLTGCVSPFLEEGPLSLEQKVSRLKDFSYDHKPNNLWYDYMGELATIAEFTDRYIDMLINSQENVPETVNILYPGSGYDVKPLLIGLKLLHQTSVQEVDFVYTEIGSLDLSKVGSKKRVVNWHKGEEDLRSMLEKSFRQYIQAGLIENMVCTVTSTGNMVSDGMESPSMSVRYSFDVCTSDGYKRLNLNLSYNQSGDRDEISHDERNFFIQQDADYLSGNRRSPFLVDVRAKFWPPVAEKRATAVYPSYFTPQQFEDADIVLSHQPGDWSLLQFDYLRALMQAKDRKENIVFTELFDRTWARHNPLPGYTTDYITLNHDDFGMNAEIKGTRKTAGGLVFMPAN